MWPAYFDSTKTRKDGRRVAKSLAVLSPKASEIKEAAERLHLECDLAPDSGYAKTPWLRSGMVLVKKSKDSKERTILKIAKQLQKNRSTTPVKP